MKNDWFHRLVSAIEHDGRSLREISFAAKCGPNYVQQMIKDGKAPGSDRLGRLLDVLGSATSLYVLTGVKVSEEDLEVLRIIQSLPAEAKLKAIDFFSALQRDEDTQ